MYKKILFIIMVVFGIFALTGCHKDEDELAEVIDKSYVWQTQEKVVAEVISIDEAKVYFRIENGFSLDKFNDWETLVLSMSSSWFDENAWPHSLKKGSIVSFMVENIEWKEYPYQIGLPEPSNVHFYIRPCE